MVSHLSLVRIDTMSCGLSSQSETLSEKHPLPIIEEQISFKLRFQNGLILSFLISILLGNVYKECYILQCDKMQMIIVGDNDCCRRSFYLCVSLVG